MARHRLHHRYAESALDPHSPFESSQEGNNSNVTTVRSFLWSHWTWQFKDKQHIDRSAIPCRVDIQTQTASQNFEYAQELKADLKLKKFGVQPIHWYSKTVTEDSTIGKLDMLYPVFLLLSIGLPIALSSGLFLVASVANTSAPIVGTTLQESTLSGFFWGFLARLITVQELTNSINSISHVLGYRNKINQTHSKRTAKNTPIIGILNFGEGFHSNHHDEPGSPDFSRRWHEIDLAYQLLRLLSFAKLAKLPANKISEQHIGKGQSSPSTKQDGP